VPDDGLNLHLVGFLSNFCTPELSDQLEVFGIVEIHFTMVVVLELRMLMQFLRNFFASKAPDTLDLKVWFFV